jgi:hypothetical protein
MSRPPLAAQTTLASSEALRSTSVQRGPISDRSKNTHEYRMAQKRAYILRIKREKLQAAGHFNHRFMLTPTEPLHVESVGVPPDLYMMHSVQT